MKIISFYSMKGGVGKTTSAVNIAYLFSQSYRTLLCDLDPQGASSFYFRIDPRLKKKTKVIAKGKIPGQIKASDFANLDILPADFSFRKLDIKLHESKGPKTRLSKALKDVQIDYDIVILDCPPTITTLADNVFYASDFVFVPMVPTPLSARTYNNVMGYVKKKQFKPRMFRPFFSMVEPSRVMRSSPRGRG